MNRFLTRLVVGWFCLASCVVAASLGAQDDAAASADKSAEQFGVTIEEVSVGFQGVRKVGHWTPVWVTLRSTSACEVQVRLSTSDPDGADVAFDVGEETRCWLPPERPTRLLRYVRFGRLQSGLTVEVLRGQATLARREIPRGTLRACTPSTTGLLVTLGPRVGWEDAVRRIGGDLEGAEVAALDTPEDLPDSWIGYEGVSAVALVVGDGDMIEALSARQWHALGEWLRLGGRLIVSCGRAGGKLLGAEGAPLGELIPARFVRTQPLPSTTGLERYAEATQRIGRNAELEVSVFEGLATVPELEEALGATTSVPLVARVPHGFGLVVLVAFDLDAAPLSAWPGRISLLSQILVGQRMRRALLQEGSRGGGTSQLGYQDMLGQLRATLDQFPGTTVIRFPWILSLIVVYLLLIGPGDYFFLRRLGIPPHWTWLTFPLLATLFAGGAVWLNQTKGRQQLANVVLVQDYDQSTRLVRGTGWAHLFSPIEYRLSAAFRPDQEKVAGLRALTVWQGLPGDGFCGLDAQAEAAPFPGRYSVGEVISGGLRSTSDPARAQAVVIHDLPMEAGVTRSLLGRWWGVLEPAGDATLGVDVDGLLTGEIVNPFPQTLDDAYVYFENWAYRIPRALGPGERFSLERQRPFNLHWRLSQRKVENSAEFGTPWDPASTDLERVMELILFYRAAGGDSYTRLTHRYQPYLDGSELIRSGRAILIGRPRTVPALSTTPNTTPEPASVGPLWAPGSALSPEQTRVWMVSRAVFPVHRTPQEP